MRFYFLMLLSLLLMVGAEAAVPARQNLPNGLRVITMPASASQLLSIDLLVDFSAIDEPYQVYGIRQVLLMAMLQGSETATGTTIRQSLVKLGGTLEGRVRQDTLEFTVTIPSVSAVSAVNALAELVCRPQLSDNGIKMAITQAQQRAGAKPTATVDLAGWYSQAVLYQWLPYATAGLGTPEGIQRITPPLVRLAHQYFVTPNNSVMSIVGKNIPQEVLQAVERQFGNWERGPARNERYPADVPKLEASQLILREEPVRSTCVMMTFPVCGSTQDDFLTLRLIETLLSGGTGSRLFRSVREQMHLAYEVSTQLPNQRNDSYFSIYALTNSRFLEETKSVLAAELARLQTELVPQDELTRAKAYFKSRYLITHQSSAQYAFDLAWYELSGLGFDYERTLTTRIDALTADEVRRVANTYFRHYYLVVVVPLLLEQPTGKTVGLYSGRLRVHS